MNQMRNISVFFLIRLIDCQSMTHTTRPSFAAPSGKQITKRARTELFSECFHKQIVRIIHRSIMFLLSSNLVNNGLA